MNVPNVLTSEDPTSNPAIHRFSVTPFVNVKQGLALYPEVLRSDGI